VKEVIQKDWDVERECWRYKNKYTGEVYDHKPAGLTDDLPTPRSIVHTGIRDKKKYFIPFGSDKVHPDFDDLRNEYKEPTGNRGWRTKEIIVKHIPGGGIEKYLKLYEDETYTPPEVEGGEAEKEGAEVESSAPKLVHAALADQRPLGLRRGREGNVFMHRHPTQLQDATTDRLRLEIQAAAACLLDPQAEKHQYPYTFAAFISTNNEFDSPKMLTLPASVENDGGDLHEILTNKSACGYDEELCQHQKNTTHDVFKTSFAEWTAKVNGVTGVVPDEEDDVDIEGEGAAGEGGVNTESDAEGETPKSPKSPGKSPQKSPKKRKKKKISRGPAGRKGDGVQSLDREKFHEKVISKKKHAVIALVYISTYGCEIKRGTTKGTYFGSKNTAFHQITRIDNTAVSLSQLITMIKKVKVQQKIIILDICHADKRKDGIFKSKFLYPGKSVFKELKKGLGPNCVVISSCDRSSKQYNTLNTDKSTTRRNSVFGTHMLEAFKGEAASGIHSHISTTQLFDYISAATATDPLSMNGKKKLVTPQKYSTFGKMETFSACSNSPCPPPAPSPPVSIKRDRFTVTVEWQNPPFTGLQLTKYELVYKYHTRCNNLWTSCALQSTVETNSFHICNLIPGMKFTARVRAWNKGGWGPFSEVSEPMSSLTAGEVTAKQKIMRAEKGGVRSIATILQNFPESVDLQLQGLTLLNAYGSQGTMLLWIFDITCFVLSFFALPRFCAGFKRRALRMLCLDVSLKALKTYTDDPDMIMRSSLVLGWSCIDDGELVAKSRCPPEINDSLFFVLFPLVLVQKWS
jgi:hypothetical protein